jgi:hypothetical protein
MTELMTIEAQIRDYDSVLVSEFMGVAKIDTSAIAFPIGTATEGWYSLNELTGGSEYTAPLPADEADEQAAKEFLESKENNKKKEPKVTGQIKLRILPECRNEPEATVESLIIDVEVEFLGCLKAMKVKNSGMTIYPVVSHRPKLSSEAKKSCPRLALIEKGQQLTHVNQHHTAHMPTDRVRQILHSSVANKHAQPVQLTLKWISHGHVQDMLNSGGRNSAKSADQPEEDDYNGDMTSKGGKQTGQKKRPSNLDTSRLSTGSMSSMGSPASSVGSPSNAKSPTSRGESESKQQQMHSMASNIEDRADYHMDGTTGWLLNSLLGGNGDQAESMEAILLGVQINLAFVSSLMQTIADLFLWKDRASSWGVFAGLCVSGALHMLLPNRWIWLVICFYVFLMWNPVYMDYERRFYLWMAARADKAAYTALAAETTKRLADEDSMDAREKLRDNYSLRETQQLAAARKKRGFFSSAKGSDSKQKAGNDNRGGLWETAVAPLVRYGWSDERGGTFRTKRFVETLYVQNQSAAQREQQIESGRAEPSASPERRRAGSGRRRAGAVAVSAPLKRMAWVIRGASNMAELEACGLGPEGWHYGRSFDALLASSAEGDKARPFVNGDRLRTRVWEWREVDENAPAMPCAAAADRSQKEMEFEARRVRDMIVAATLKTEHDKTELLEKCALRVQTRWRARKGLLGAHMVRNAKRQLEKEREIELVVTVQAVARRWLHQRDAHRKRIERMDAEVRQQEQAERETEEAFMDSYSCMPGGFLRFRPCKQGREDVHAMDGGAALGGLRTPREDVHKSRC